jgi:adenylate cyclase
VLGWFIIDAALWASLVLTFVLCFFSVALVLIVRSFAVDIGWPVLLFAGFFIVTGSLLVLTKIHLLSALPGLSGSLASILATGWERLFANRERDRLREMFSSYMEQDLIDRMIEQRELPKLEGESLEVTAFFSDIQGFSSISERYADEPHKLMRLLNRYLSTVTPELTQEGACIDKYIGDAVVALFGAPVRHRDHALRACRAALAVQVAVRRLNVALHAEGLPELVTRIGLNTDEMLVGNIGSEQLLDYTAIGDGMNLAARLEGSNKQFGTEILIGERTHRAVKDAVVTRELDTVRVAGKSEDVRVYELVGLLGNVPTPRLAALKHYARALAAYRSRQFSVAHDAARDAVEADPSDAASAHFLDRCRTFRDTPPSADWDGVTVLAK